MSWKVGEKKPSYAALWERNKGGKEKIFRPREKREEERRAYNANTDRKRGGIDPHPPSKRKKKRGKLLPSGRGERKKKTHK